MHNRDKIVLFLTGKLSLYWTQQEEADTKIIVHVKHSLRKGFRSIVVKA